MFQRIYQLLEGPVATRFQQCPRGGIQALIFVNVVAVILETVQPIGDRYALLFDAIEMISNDG